MEAYGNYSELQAQGVELMEFIRSKDEEDERDIFSYVEEEDEEEEEEGNREVEGRGVEDGGGGGGGKELDDRGDEEETTQLFRTNFPHSPYMQKKILYFNDTEPAISFPGRRRVHYLAVSDKQVPPTLDAVSVYSAPSLLSLHSTVEPGSSRHEELKVFVHSRSLCR